MPRAPRKPVSDRSLYLWLSAVLGVWLGITQATVGLIDLGYWNHMRTATVAFAVVLSILVIASHPRATLGTALVSATISVVCAAGALNIGWEFPALLFPESILEGVTLFAFGALLMAWAVLVIRFLMAWFVLFVIIGALRVFNPRLVPPGPTECRWCRYDQSGLPAHENCPECGRPWNPPSYHRARARALRRASNRWARPIRAFCTCTVATAAIGVVVSQFPMFIVLARYHGLHVEKGDSQGVGLWTYGQVGGIYRTNFTLTDRFHRQIHLVIWTDSRIHPEAWDFPRPMESAIYTDVPTTDIYGNGLSQPAVRGPGLITRGSVRMILDMQPREWR